MRVFEFVEKILSTLETKPFSLKVMIDENFYPNKYGYTVKPMYVKADNIFIKFSDMINIFGKPPLVNVSETKRRVLYDKPSFMIINTKEKKVFNEIEYFDYSFKLIKTAVDKKVYEKLKEGIKEKLKELNEKDDENEEEINIDDFL